MASQNTPLKEVDRVEITTVLDNFIDVLLPGSETVRRVSLGPDWLTKETLVAEHGFAAIVKVSAGNTSDSILFDAGLSKNGLTHNLDVLDGKPKEFHTIVLSHGHADHTRGLMGLVERLGPRKMPLLLHPDALLERKVVFPDGHEFNLPPPDYRVLHHEGIELIQERAPSYLVGGLIMVTGQVHRSTDFETGFPIHQAKVAGHWQPDPLIHDDQAVVVNLKGKGLVVLTGCGHAGAINTIRHAQKLTGVQRVHAVMGGFHLSGAIFEPIIGPTVAALKEIGPQMVVPAHCTGWRATHAIAREFPNAFVQNSVGTRFVL
ncbi:MAG: MBL fold metallo-hydrolase [Candidatus Binataceae bacterium]|jgi:7,8-dihydropterin-6-yl-methyl-4-(beta-D-ribofuranosyl)aminobenzene 5'-phosphate synthase